MLTFYTYCHSQLDWESRREPQRVWYLNVHKIKEIQGINSWIPAFAGMTERMVLIDSMLGGNKIK